MKGTIQAPLGDNNNGEIMAFKLGKEVYVKPSMKGIEGEGRGKIISYRDNQYLVQFPNGSSGWFYENFIIPSKEASSLIKTKWKFDAEFKDIFLDLWFDKSPETYSTAFTACDEVGNDMIIWLGETNKELFNNLYKETLGEKRG